ncbi:hypothetical protein ACU7M1_33000 [Burkholderia pseudomallei]|uniref:hypothetical protein n=1 Tax=Burkholderia pseudomallei TaxID=28450 RepID=UPI00406C20D3
MRYPPHSGARARGDAYRFVTACSCRARRTHGFPQGSRYAAKPRRRPNPTLAGTPQAPQAPKRPARAVRADDARAARGKPAHASVCYTKSRARPGLY